MKYLAFLIALQAGPVFAHGGHMPMPEDVHSVTHLMPVIALTVLGIGLVYMWRARL